MKKNTQFVFIALIVMCTQFTNAQVGVGTTAPRGALEINSSTQGVVLPQVALTDITVQAPVVNPQGGVIPAGTFVWNTNTAGVIPNNVSPGIYYWNGTRWISVAGSPGGLDWSIIGNGGIDGGVTGVTGTPAALGVNFLGTYDNTNVDIKTSGLPVARFSSLGEFFVGAIETVLPGDLMNAVSEGNATFPWAVNGYTDQNGGGVYGSVTGGNTNFAAVQGEYAGTSNVSAGVRGTSFRSIDADGTSFFQPIKGVEGALPDTTPGTYSRRNQYGVSGVVPSNTGRVVGGVFGINMQNGAYGMLGYERSNGGNYGMLSSTNYIAGTFGGTAKISNQTDASIGLGTQGGFLGAHVKGNQLGMIAKGKIAGLYADGASITNKGFAVIDKDINNKKMATYVPTSTTVDVSTKGMGKLVNGKAFISFDDNYSNLITADKPIIVTVSPMGETNGIYVSSVTEKGFTIKENNKGISNVNFYWMAIAEKHNASELVVNDDLLQKDFDNNLDHFLTINEGSDKAKAMWWNGNSLEFGESAPKNENEGFKEAYIGAQRYDENKRVAPRKYLRASQNKK